MPLTTTTRNATLNVTNAVVGTGAVSSPFWLPALEQTSQVAAMVVPILGAIWLAVQITMKMREYIKDNEDK